MIRTRLNPIFLLGVALSVLVLALTVQARRARASADHLGHTRTSLETLRRDADEILSLRHARETVATHQRPTQDVIAQVNAMLIEAGIPTQRLRSLTEVSDTPVTTSANGSSPDRTPGRLRSQVMALQLQALSLAELGQFLHAWRRHQDLWSVSRIELLHHRGVTQARSRGRNTASAAADSDLYDTQLWMTAVYLAHS